MKKEIPVKQLGAARIPSPLPLSSKSKYENFDFVKKDNSGILQDATECSKGNKNKFLFNSLNRIQFVFFIYQLSWL